MTFSRMELNLASPHNKLKKKSFFKRKKNPLPEHQGVKIYELFFMSFRKWKGKTT